MNAVDSFMLGHWSFQGNCPTHCKVKVVKLSSLKLESQAKDKSFENGKRNQNQHHGPKLLKKKSFYSNRPSPNKVCQLFILENSDLRPEVHNNSYDDSKFVSPKKKFCKLSPWPTHKSTLEISTKPIGKELKLRLKVSETGNWKNKLNRNFGETKLVENRSKTKESEDNSDCFYTEKFASTSDYFKDKYFSECLVLVEKLKDDSLYSPRPKGDLLNGSNTSLSNSSKIKTNSFSNKTMTKLSGKKKELSKPLSNKSRPRPISNIESIELNSVCENNVTFGISAACSSYNVQQGLSKSVLYNDKESSFEENLPRRSARLIKLLESSTASSCNSLELKNNSIRKSCRKVPISSSKENNEPLKSIHKVKKLSTKLSSSEHKSSCSIPSSEKEKLKTCSRKPTLKYLKERNCKLQGNFCSKSDSDHDLFSSSFGDIHKNSALHNFLQNDPEDMDDYLTFLTPNSKLNSTTSAMTPRTNLLNEWGKAMKTPTTSITPQHTNKSNKDKQGVLAVVFHHLRDKPKRLKNLKHGTHTKILKTKQNWPMGETPQSVMSILQEHNENNDDCLDEYFGEID